MKKVYYKNLRMFIDFVGLEKYSISASDMKMLINEIIE